MGKAIFRTEMRLLRRGLVIWGVVLLLVVAIYLGVFPVMSDPDTAAAFENYPEAFRAAFDISAAVIMDVNVYYGQLIMNYIVLLATIWALMTAAGLLTREIDLGAAEFLYTRPVTRNRIMDAKVRVFLVSAISLWILTYLAATVIGFVVAPNEFDPVVQAGVHLAGLVATLAAGGIGFALGARLSQLQAATSLGVGIGLGMFLLDTLRKLSEQFDVLKYLSLYWYAGLDRAAVGDPFWGGMAFLVGVFALGTGVGLVLLRRREFAG